MEKKLWIPLALISAAVLAIMACAPSAQPAAAPAPGGPGAAAPAAAPAPAKPAQAPAAAKMPKRGGTFVFTGAATGDPVAWHPLDQAHAAGAIKNAVSCNLVKWDHRPGHPTAVAAGEVFPDLAESWENPTPTKYIFHLRKGVKTQTGKEVVAGDVKWYLELMYDKSRSRINSWYGEINPSKDIEIPDPYTIIFNLPHPDADFLTGQGGSYTNITFNTKAEPTDDPNWKKWGGYYSSIHNLDGCGPWKAVEYQIASHIVLERRDDHWEMGKDGKPLPYLDRVEHRYIFDPSAQLASLRAGQVMAIPEFANISLELADQVARDNPGLTVKFTPGGFFWPINYDLYNPPFNDIRVRRALGMATDRVKWIQSQFKGRGMNVYGMLPLLGDWVLSTDKMDPNKEGKWWRYNPQEAKKLLAEAGYPEGFSFNYPTSPPQQQVTALEVWAGMIKKDLNVKMSIQLVEYAGKVGVEKSGMTSGFIVRPELKSFVWALQHPRLRTTGTNPALGATRPYIPADTPNVKEFEALVDKQQVTLDVAERKKLVHEMQRMGADNMWNFYFPVNDNARLYYPYVKDWEPYMGWTWGELMYTWLDK